MRQLQLSAHGEPSDVIELNTVAESALGQEDVLISMEARSIHRTFCSSVGCTASGRPSHPRSVRRVLDESPKRDETKRNDNENDRKHHIYHRRRLGYRSRIGRSVSQT